MLRIREIRNRRKITQEEISSATGIPKRTFINYELGLTDIPLGKLQLIATYLEVSVCQLIEEEGPATASSQILNRNFNQQDNSAMLFAHEMLGQAYDALKRENEALRDMIYLLKKQESGY